MDFVNKLTGGSSQQQGQEQGQQQQTSSGQQGGGGIFSGIGDKLNSAAGGGRESEKNEDLLDKGTHSMNFGCLLIPRALLWHFAGIDFVQEKFMGQGPQDNESALEQAKDEQISDYIRKQYKGMTGSDFPIKDKETRFSWSGSPLHQWQPMIMVILCLF